MNLYNQEVNKSSNQLSWVHNYTDHTTIVMPTPMWCDVKLHYKNDKSVQIILII